MTPRMSLKFWQYPWFFALLLSLVALGGYGTGLFTPWQNAFYAQLQRLDGRESGGEITVLAIDARSAAALGAPPWTYGQYARLLDVLFSIETRLTVLSDPLPATSPSPALIQLDEIIRYYESALVAGQDNNGTDIFNPDLTLLGARLRTMRQHLDGEALFGASLKKARNTILSLPFRAAESSTDTLADELRPYVLSQVRSAFGDKSQYDGAVAAQDLHRVSADLLAAAAGVGLLPDGWTDARRMPLVVAQGGHYLPTLPLVLATQARHLKASDIEVELGKGVRWGAHTVNTDAHLQMRPFLYAPAKITQVSALDVLEGRADQSLLQHKIVLIGSTLPPVSALPHFAAGEFIAPVMHLANSAASLLNNDVITDFPYAALIQSGLITLIGIYVLIALPRLSLAHGLALSFAALALMATLVFALLSLTRQWLPLLPPMLILSAGQLGYALQYYWHKRHHPGRSRSENIARLRLEGLACQGQGKLELAFEKFAQCPADELILSLLYNLALDFERRRQNREALAVYRYIAACKGDFRDIEQRMERLNKTRRPPQVSSTNLNQWLDNEHDFKPTLGRYQIERRLAKGAMGGEVYLGKDPKLDRMVALKTLALGEEFEGEELLEATARFFREAAAAGRLTHPNIISVYDAGEENDLAYISMEFFKGGDLSPFTKPDNLLPLAVVLDIMLTACDALDYAHRQGVVHRDIKPANIMYNRASGSLKLTDFGIARIMDSKKTKTGIILGTPSYMAPEQLAGKTVDGRADLFSLGITLYQLLTGHLPFTADSMASLMFKIASEAHPDILSLRPELPLCVKQIIDILLQKEPAQRYASGAELAIALRECKMQVAVTAYLPSSESGITP
jgi:eukaryotic-like serine/threonine-protein kinase